VLRCVAKAGSALGAITYMGGSGANAANLVKAAQGNPANVEVQFSSAAAIQDQLERLLTAMVGHDSVFHSYSEIPG